MRRLHRDASPGNGGKMAKWRFHRVFFGVFTNRTCGVLVVLSGFNWFWNLVLAGLNWFLYNGFYWGFMGLRWLDMMEKDGKSMFNDDLSTAKTVLRVIDLSSKTEMSSANTWSLLEEGMSHKKTSDKNWN